MTTTLKIGLLGWKGIVIGLQLVGFYIVGPIGDDLMTIDGDDGDHPDFQQVLFRMLIMWHMVTVVQVVSIYRDQFWTTLILMALQLVVEYQFVQFVGPLVVSVISFIDTLATGLYVREIQNSAHFQPI